MHAEGLPTDISAKVRLLTEKARKWKVPKALAYLNGLLGHRFQVRGSELVHEQARAIYRRQLRIFGQRIYPLPRARKQNIIVCIVGLKGCGKSSIIQALASRGEQTLEVYRELEEIRQKDAKLFASLSPAHLWRDEPLRIGFERRGFHKEMPKRLFIGSLLRHEELQYLTNFGRLLLIYISASNRVRHERARLRGRAIEQQASEEKLIELDAHRGGEWPGYETNDVGGLIAQASFTVTNNAYTRVDRVAQRILGYILRIERED